MSPKIDSVVARCSEKASLMSRKISFIALLALIFLIGARVSAGRPKAWPLIAPLSWSGDIDLARPSTLMSIHSAKGAILYRLYCSSWYGSVEPEWLTGGDNYSGDFGCLLTDGKPGEPAERVTLLNYDPDDTSAYHFNRGSFDWSEMLGTCWNDPEWGADRTFYLRGMRLRIRVMSVHVDEFHYNRSLKRTFPAIRSVTMKITARPDKKGETDLARPPELDEPSNCRGPEF